MLPSVSLRLLVLVVGSLLLGLATVPVMKVAVEQALPGPPPLEKLTRYQAAADGTATWDIGRASRRWLVLIALTAFLSLRRWVPWRSLVRRGLRGPERWRRLRFGLLTGAAASIAYVAVTLATGAVEPDQPAATYFWRKLVEYTASAALIALLEELFFRAVLFRAMLRDWGVCRALVVSNLVFAGLHAISGGYRAALGWQPWIGLDLLRTYYTVDGSPWPDLRLMVGLFLLGLLLCLVYLRTGSVWASIGVHAAIVYVTRLSKTVTARTDGFPEWLLGDPVFLVSGVAVWALLVAGIVLLPRFAPAGPLARRRQREK